MNIGCIYLLNQYFLGRYIPKSGISGSYDSFIFKFLGNCHTFIPTSNVLEFPLLHILANTCYLLSFLMIVILTGLVAQLVKNPLQCRRPLFNPWVRKIPWRRDRLLTPVFLGFPCGSDGKESTCNAGDLDSILGLARSPGGHNNPFQYSSLDKGALRAIVHGVTESDMTE